jgi:hypothetical protein
MIDNMPTTTSTDDVRQDAAGGRPRILIRSFHTAGRWVGADVYVGEWRVNHRRYATIGAACRRAAREIQNTRSGTYGGPA